jgi:hypothetical protein
MESRLSRDADEFPIFHGNSRSDAAPPLETPVRGDAGPQLDLYSKIIANSLVLHSVESRHSSCES